jgi:hypothetical protein
VIYFQNYLKWLAFSTGSAYVIINNYDSSLSYYLDVQNLNCSDLVHKKYILYFYVNRFHLTHRDNTTRYHCQRMAVYRDSFSIIFIHHFLFCCQGYGYASQRKWQDKMHLSCFYELTNWTLLRCSRWQKPFFKYHPCFGIFSFFFYYYSMFIHCLKL